MWIVINIADEESAFAISKVKRIANRTQTDPDSLQPLNMDANKQIKVIQLKGKLLAVADTFLMKLMKRLEYTQMMGMFTSRLDKHKEDLT